MKPMNIAMLGGAAAIAVGIATFINLNQSGEGEAAAMFENLAPRINDVALVQIQRRDAEFSIQRSGDQWELVEKGNFPVRFDRVRETVVGLASLKAPQAMTSREDRYARIGVQNPEDAEPGNPAGPTLITLKDDAGEVLVSAIVGNSRLGANPGVYIRRPGEAQSWLAEGRLEIPGQFTGWVEPQILSIPRDRVQSVDITPADGQPFRVERSSPAERSFTVVGVPPGAEVRSTTAADAFGSALSFLSFEDVAPIDAIFVGSSSAAARTQLDFRTFDGLMLSVHLLEHGGRTWASIAAMPDAQEEPALGVIEEAARLNSTIAQWAYALPAYKTSVMKVTMTDLLEDGRPMELPASMMQDGIELHDLSAPLPPPP